MRDFTDDLKELRVASTRPNGYLKIEPNRNRFEELEAEVARPDLWDDQDAAKKLNAEYANVKGDIDGYDGLSQELEDAEVLHELAREIDDETQEPDLQAASSTSRRASTARAAQPVHRRARRGRLHRADQREGRWRRRPGLGRDPAAHVFALGRAAWLRLRGRRASARAPRPASCRPSSRSPVATPTGS
jgi:hypothetical protein